MLAQELSNVKGKIMISSARRNVGTSERRNVETSERRNVGTSERRNVGRLERRNVGRSERRKVGRSERRKVGRSERRNVGRSRKRDGHVQEIRRNRSVEDSPRNNKGRLSANIARGFLKRFWLERSDEARGGLDHV